MTPIVHTQNMVVGLNLYLGSQSICIVGFGFLTMGGPILGNLSTLLFPPTLLFTSQSHYLSFFEWLCFSLPVLSRIANPFFLIHFSQLQARISGGVMITSPYQCEWGLIPSFQSGYFVGKGGSDIGTNSHLQKPARQQCYQRHYRAAERKASPSNNAPDQVRNDRGGLLEVFKSTHSHLSSWAQIGP